jgi:hypothetical protein
MVTQQMVIQKILAHLNGNLSGTNLVHWAEDAVVELTESDVEIPNEQDVLDILMALGAGDTPGFPLTWEVLSGYLEQLGVRVRVIAEAS